MIIGVHNKNVIILKRTALTKHLINVKHNIGNYRLLFLIDLTRCSNHGRGNSGTPTYKTHKK